MNMISPTLSIRHLASIRLFFFCLHISRSAKCLWGIVCRGQVLHFCAPPHAITISHTFAQTISVASPSALFTIQLYKKSRLPLHSMPTVTNTLSQGKNLTKKKKRCPLTHSLKSKKSRALFYHAGRRPTQSAARSSSVGSSAASHAAAAGAVGEKAHSPFSMETSMGGEVMVCDISNGFVKYYGTESNEAKLSFFFISLCLFYVHLILLRKVLTILNLLFLDLEIKFTRVFNFYFEFMRPLILI